jgi:hypothetical protein
MRAAMYLPHTVFHLIILQLGVSVLVAENPQMISLLGFGGLGGAGCLEDFFDFGFIVFVAMIFPS